VQGLHGGWRRHVLSFANVTPMAGIFRRIGRAVGNVAAGYDRAKDAAPRRDAQRCMLALMAEDPDASDKAIATRARKRLATEHGDDDERLDFVSTKAVENLRRALAVAALERKNERDEENE
jgi:hypothetical protein